MKGEKAIVGKEWQIEYDDGHEGKHRVVRSFPPTDLAGLFVDCESVGAIPVAAVMHTKTGG